MTLLRWFDEFLIKKGCIKFFWQANYKTSKIAFQLVKGFDGFLFLFKKIKCKIIGT